MRRSGSSSCILRSRSSLTEEELREQMSVTMITSKRLPLYSVERYYMLSEIEQNAKSIIFLNEQDHPYYAKIDEKKSVEGDTNACDMEFKSNENGETFVILYLLWQPHMYHTQSAFQTMVELTVCRVLQHFGETLQLASKGTESSTSTPSKESDSDTDSNSSSSGDVASFKTKIHLVVDRISKKISNDQESENDNGQGHKDDEGLGKKSDAEVAELHHAVEIKSVERLARSLAMSKRLRTVLQGITIGVTPEVRAAPALESILKSIMFGGKERRRLVLQHKKKLLNSSLFNDNSDNLDLLMRSPIHVVAPSSDELIGIDFEGETDAVQGILQSVTFAEWNGNGDYKSFSRRALDTWKKEYGLDAFDEEDNVLNESHFEDASSAMVIAFLLCVLAIFWLRYGELINEYVKIFR